MTPWRSFVERLPAHPKPARVDPIRLVCFDLDGVLTEEESSWVAVHRHFGVDNERGLHEFLGGRITEEEFIRRDVALWLAKRPALTLQEIEVVLEGLTLVPGAAEAVAALQDRGVECAIVSGGIESAVRSIARRLGIRHYSGNALSTDAQGRLTGTGVVHTPLRDKGGPVQRLAKALRTPMGQVASVGNSSPDIAMFRTSGLGIAFRPADEFVRAAADVNVAGNDLRAILPVVLLDAGTGPHGR